MATYETSDNQDQDDFSTCRLPKVPERALPAALHPDRLAAIRVSDKTWVNETVLHYYFFDQDSDGSWVEFTDGSREWRSWRGEAAQMDAVRQAFKAWKDLGIGLRFEEVADRTDAEVRIGFMRGDGSWSYVGRDVIDVASDPNERTMNFGWDLTTPHGRDTALHEIGHTLGLPHEHQNPNAGIDWDEPAVYRYFQGPPNNWDRATIDWNILRKLNPNTVQGSKWDADSIMHYAFPAGLIENPEEYRNGLRPQPGLSEADKTWIRKFYPAVDVPDHVELKPFESQRLRIAAGQQVNFRISPTATRTYTIQTFGVSDVVMVLFQLRDGEPRYLDGDDDSGEAFNAKLEVRLERGQDYVLRLRLYYSFRAGETAVMMW